MHAWPPLTQASGVDVSLWLCLANVALTVDAPNPSKCSVEPSAGTNMGLTQVPSRKGIYIFSWSSLTPFLLLANAVPPPTARCWKSPVVLPCAGASPGRGWCLVICYLKPQNSKQHSCPHPWVHGASSGMEKTRAFTSQRRLFAWVLKAGGLRQKSKLSLRMAL